MKCIPTIANIVKANFTTQRKTIKVQIHGFLIETTKK